MGMSVQCWYQWQTPVPCAIIYILTIRFEEHDVHQPLLGQKLDEVVVSCVNGVGVELNTASAPLLERVSGVSASLAKAIVEWRNENGKFRSREDLKKVKGLGEKAFEQCAGFLRIPGAANILDTTAIHPESYDAVTRLFEKQGVSVKQEKDLEPLRAQIGAWNVNALADVLGIGVPTLKDILEELKKPGRDPRDAFEQPVFRSDVMHLEDLREGMVLTGTVRNVIDFGAFVDIGVHQDGLVHISQLADKFVKHPMDVVKTGDVVKVRVLSVDVNKKRIALTMKNIGNTLN